MRVIKLGFISVVVFAIIITGISLFFPSHIRVSKAIDINTSRDSVMSQLNKAENWKNWYPGSDTLSLLVTDGKIKGLTTGAHRALVIENTTDSSVTALNIGPDTKGDGSSGWNVFNSGTPNTVTVQWYMDFHLHWYPWEKFSSLLLEKRYGPVMEVGLSRLKALLEHSSRQ